LVFAIAAASIGNEVARPTARRKKTMRRYVQLSSDTELPQIVGARSTPRSLASRLHRWEQQLNKQSDDTDDD
jgi:hypothetical protein